MNIKKKIIEKFRNFFKSIFSFFTRNKADNSEEEDISNQFNKEVTSVNEERIKVERRTLMTKLYILEQEITVFETDYPDEYEMFMDRIKSLRTDYISSLEHCAKLLTFEIDPELDWGKSGEILKLENDIKTFIEKEMKFNIISKRLQRLITKLNILYNVSIFHSKESEKQKVRSQLVIALETATQLAREFKECEYIVEDMQLKERIVSLISYVDYEIFKTSIRNSNKIPDELIKKLVMMVEFDNFDYISVFKAFIKDELTDLGGLLPLITDEKCCEALRKKLLCLLTSLVYSDDLEKEFLDTTFWNNFLALESCILEMLKDSGVNKEQIKVSLIVRMDVSIDESDVLVLPITNAFLSLTSIYSKTQDDKILVLIKLLKNMSNNITYKEIYFLLLLFDAIEILINNPNELIKHIEKYVKKYPYDTKTIMEKKEHLINSQNKEYVTAFSINDYETEIVTILKKLNIDFKVMGNEVLINSFYFNGLKNVTDSLETNSNTL